MHRSVYVSIVLVPLVLALGLLIFAIGTEYWTQLDYTRIKNLTFVESNPNYEVKRVKFEFPKYTSLFGECEEFKQISILVPVQINQQNQKTQLNEPEINKNLSDNEESLRLGFLDYDTDGCMSRQKCNELNAKEKDTCFCCNNLKNNKNKNNYESNDNCCYLKSKLCDGVSNCRDKSDELENCPIRKLYYSSRYYDNKYNCLRHQYEMISFVNKVIDRNFSDSNDNFCLRRLFKSNSYSIKIFTLRVLTIFGIITCILFTLLCLLSIIFVSCCYNLSEKRKLSINHANEFNYALASEEDYETDSITNKSKCCKCNCLLCPFVFYSLFAFLAFISCLFSLCTYLFTLCYIRNAFLIYDPEFIPEHITQAYQYNSWLFDIQQFGISFYALVISFALYLLVFILSTCISCRIQMSPAWKGRYTNSYEVLQMQDIVMNKSANGKQATTSSFYKKISKENKNNEKEAKKIGKKYKKKSKENNEDGYSLSGESATLTTPKTRLNGLDESYE